MELRPLTPADRAPLHALLRAIPSFTPEEVEVAMELVDVALTRSDQRDYEFILASLDGEVAGYVCFGPTPMTQGTYDLYWIATHPRFARRGVARALVRRMDQILAARGARLVRIETSSQESYGSAHGFYEALGFAEEARIRDFYKPNDDLILFSHRLDAHRPQHREMMWEAAPDIDRLEPPGRVPVRLELRARRGDDLETWWMDSRWFVPDAHGWERLVGEVPQFQLVARLGDLDLSTPFDGPAAWRLVLVLRKVG